ncbi:MAG: hypothetical protein KBH14_07910 [Vicinamibacteria bacterium]|jgi:hypothetical protein|nr:hypothetical protein [Vicinamibacteria bacterium]MBP9946304.1 hypothetical protein [Vicinamibacteria bacterium]
MAVHISSKLFILNHRELAFLQKISRAEYQFITDEEQTARQSLRDKLNEVVLSPKENRIAVNLTTDELVFLAVIVKENFSFVTATEKDARTQLHDRLVSAAGVAVGA